MAKRQTKSSQPKERGKFVRFRPEKQSPQTHVLRTHEGFVINDIIAISKREYGECWLDLAKVLLKEMRFETSKQ